MAWRTAGGGGEGSADALAHAAALELEAELEIEELFEDEALVGGGGGAHELDHRRTGFREVDALEGFEARRQLETGEHRGRQSLIGCDLGGAAALDELFEDGPDDAAHPLGGELGAPGSGSAEALVYGDDAAHFEHGEFSVRAGGSGLRQDLELGLDHFEAPGGRALTGDRRGGHGGARRFEFAVYGDHLAGLELVFEIGSMEPDALDGAEALAQGELEHGAAASAQKGRSADLADDGGHGAGNELGHRLRVEAIFIAERQVIEEILDCFDAAFGETFADALADTLDELYRGREFQHTAIVPRP